jgi:hypothetical protein
MNNGTNTISTNLYNLISAMHDEHGSIDSRIPKKIEAMAASGKIKWGNPRICNPPQKMRPKTRRG